MTKYIKILFIAILLIISASRATASIYSQDEICNDPKNPTNLPCVYANGVPAGMGYQYLAPLPNPADNGNVQVNIDPADPAALSNYLNMIIKLFIGICAVLAVIMIVIGGMQYMTTDLASSKEEGTSRIWGAVMGLVLALGSYAILYTINPNLLKSDLKTISTITLKLDVGGESPDPFKSLTTSSLKSLGIDCPGGGKGAVQSIGSQFIGKTTYSMATGQRNTIQGNKVILDCSAFVSQVYVCAGLSNPGGNTGAIFSPTSGAVKVTGATFDFTKLNPGDLIGWKQGDNGEKYGHVAIYIGNGQILDTQPGGTEVRPLNSLKNRVTYVKWP